MKLHVEIEGAGSDVVLLHGWGLNSRIWDRAARTLSRSCRVHRIDLPGHGRSEWHPDCARLDDFTRTVAPYVPRNATLLGWSLGAMVALRLAALAPERIASLILVSATPRFVTGETWTAAMTPQVLAGFGQKLREDFRGTVQDFLALQVRGDERELSSLRELRHQLLAGGLPHPPALEAGLEILRTVDLRSSLPVITQPTLVLAGQHDRVTPPQASRLLAQALPGAQYHEVQRAGHALFISHADEFHGLVREFIERTSTPRVTMESSP